jgi:hypothetical protein
MTIVVRTVDRLYRSRIRIWEGSITREAQVKKCGAYEVAIWQGLKYCMTKEERFP